MLLVSKRWNRLFFSEPALWHNMHVTAYCFETVAEQQRRLERREALLRRVAPLARCFTWRQHIDEEECEGYAEVQEAEEAAQVGLARCLSALQPGQLAELRLHGDVSLQGAAGAALRQLTSIRSLLLECCTEQGTATAVAAIGSNLCSLHLHTASLSPAVADSIGQLAQLTELGIQAREWPELGALTRLSQLKQLVLLGSSDQSERPMQPPPPAKFPAGLEQFCFESRQHPFQARALLALLGSASCGGLVSIRSCLRLGGLLWIWPHSIELAPPLLHMMARPNRCTCHCRVPMHRWADAR